jgi:hypothetical protein
MIEVASTGALTLKVYLKSATPHRLLDTLCSLIRVMIEWVDKGHTGSKEPRTMKRRHVCLMAEQRGELLHVRDHDPVPSMRDVCCRDLESGRWLAHLPGCGQWPQ